MKKRIVELRASVFGYCFLAYLITWSSKFIFSALQTDRLTWNVSLGLLQLTAQFGPTLAGLIIIFSEQGRDGLLNVLRSLTRFRLKMKWYIFAVFIELALFICVALYLEFTGYGNLTLHPDLFLKGFGVFFTNAIPLILLTGLGEEIGWRGFLLPRLQSKYNIVIVALMLTLIISFWHLRTDFIPLLFQKNLRGFLDLYFPDIAMRLLISAPVVFIQIYLFNKTKGSLLMMVIFHGTSNAPYEWLKYVTGNADPSAALPVFAALLWLTSVFFFPAIIRQSKRGELVTTIT